ncbi:aldehyde dehydrogenase family protein [Sphingomonas sp.]|uniref:aldehyde dehydrogenase family protein n=1 Tax=Sphingomonas sp. TaxID=28214 RepID=UPI0035B138A6
MTFAQRAAFLAELPVSLATRQDRLVRAARMVEGQAEALCRALVADGRHPDVTAARQADVTPALAVLRDAARKVGDWIRPAPADGWLGRMTRGDDYIACQPLGVVGLAASHTLPLSRTMGLLAGALAAGNRVVIRFDPATPHLAERVAAAVATAFDPAELTIASSDDAFAAMRFDRLVISSPATADHDRADHDGGNHEGAGAVTIHRSGKTPVILGRSTDFARAAERIVAAKLVQAGRVPLTPDYLLVPAEQEEMVGNWLCRAAARLFPRIGDEAGDTRLTPEESTRIDALLADARVRGGTVLTIPAPRAGRAPLHIVRHASDDMAILREEIAGPILPLRNYAPIDEAITETHTRQPLAICYFGRDAAERQQVLARTISSTIAINGPALLGPALPGPALLDRAVSAVGLTLAGEHGEAAFRQMSQTRRVCRPPLLDIARARVELGIRGLPALP